MLCDFASFVAEDLADGTEDSLGGLLESWIARGNVIEDFGGDYGAYMLVVALAVAQFHDDPSFYGDSARLITSVFTLGTSFWRLPQAIDPDQWKEWVFRIQRGDQIEL